MSIPEAVDLGDSRRRKGSVESPCLFSRTEKQLVGKAFSFQVQSCSLSADRSSLVGYDLSVNPAGIDESVQCMLFELSSQRQLMVQLKIVKAGPEHFQLLFY
jgi:hypothetical protein